MHFVGIVLREENMDVQLGAHSNSAMMKHEGARTSKKMSSSGSKIRMWGKKKVKRVSPFYTIN
jgi:hypothetical protein